MVTPISFFLRFAKVIPKITNNKEIEKEEKRLG